MAQGMEDTAKGRLDEMVRARLVQDPLYAPHAELFFEALEELGRGGVGSVMRVRDHRLDRELALKTLKDPVAEPETAERFLREARLTARLCHPNIPAVHEAGRTSSGHIYILMRIVEGRTLKDHIRAYHKGGRQPEELRRLLEVLVKVCEAMAYAHAQDIVHRDLKPANIMIGAYGEVMVLDWGLAKSLNETEPEEPTGLTPDLEAEDGLTIPGALLGTPGYMAPEQAQGRAVDARADIFALGATLCELLTGEPPVAGATPVARVMAVSSGAIRTPRELLASAPRELDALAAEALAFKPSRRRLTAEAMASELRAYLAGAPLATIPYSLGERLGRAVRRRSGLLLGLLAALVLAMASAEAWRRLDAAFAENDQEIDRARVERRAAEEAERSAAERLAKEKRARAKEQARTEAMLRQFARARVRAVLGGDPELLREAVEAAMALNQRSYHSLLEGGRVYCLAGRFAWARELFKEAVAFPPAYEAWLQLHDLEILALDEGGAVMTEGLRGLLRQSAGAEDPGAYVLWARAQERLVGAHGRPGEAAAERGLKEALELLRRAEGYGEAFTLIPFTRGLLYMELGDPERAAASFDRAVIERPRFAPAWRQRALARLALGLTESALDDASRAVEIYPRFPRSFVIRAVCLIRAGQAEAALDELQRALEISPDYKPALVARARLRFARGEWAAAEQDYQSLLALEPDDARSHASRGLVLWKLGRNDEARAAFDRAVELEPESAALLSDRAAFFLELGELDAAAADLVAALKIAPDHPLALLNSADFENKSGRPEAAAELYRRFLARWPKHEFADKAREEFAALARAEDE